MRPADLAGGWHEHGDKSSSICPALKLRDDPSQAVPRCEHVEDDPVDLRLPHLENNEETDASSDCVDTKRCVRSPELTGGEGTVHVGILALC